MTFGPAFFPWLRRAARAALLPALLAAPAAFADNLGFAVVPTQIIYPGELIDAKRLQTVEVTNKNLAKGYAQEVSQVQGLVTTRTLLPGRTIMVAGLRPPYTIKRGDKILLVFDNGGLRITASGTPLADAAIGELIQVRNTDTGVIVSGTVMQDRSVLVVQK
jgi:flagella basal body P-ring formation protein FlgA